MRLPHEPSGVFRHHQQTLWVQDCTRLGACSRGKEHWVTTAHAHKQNLKHTSSTVHSSQKIWSLQSSAAAPKCMLHCTAHTHLSVIHMGPTTKVSIHPVLQTGFCATTACSLPNPIRGPSPPTTCCPMPHQPTCHTACRPKASRARQLGGVCARVLCGVFTPCHRSHQRSPSTCCHLQGRSAAQTEGTMSYFPLPAICLVPLSSSCHIKGQGRAHQIMLFVLL